MCRNKLYIFGAVLLIALFLCSCLSFAETGYGDVKFVVSTKPINITKVRSLTLRIDKTKNFSENAIKGKSLYDVLSMSLVDEKGNAFKPFVYSMSPGILEVTGGAGENVMVSIVSSLANLGKNVKTETLNPAAVWFSENNGCDYGKAIGHMDQGNTLKIPANGKFFLCYALSASGITFSGSLEQEVKNITDAIQFSVDYL